MDSRYKQSRYPERQRCGRDFCSGPACCCSVAGAAHPPPTGVPPQSPSIAVGPEGNVYVAYRQGAFYALAPDGSVRWQFTTGKSGAVSYTHLRAHETGRNLVCRLLLEKKKKKKK